MVSCNIQYSLWAPYCRSDWGSQRLLHAQDPPASGWTSLWWKRRSIHGSVNTHSILTARQPELRTGVQRVENRHLLSVWAKSSFFFIKLFCSSFIWKHFLLKPENEKKKSSSSSCSLYNIWRSMSKTGIMIIQWRKPQTREAFRPRPQSVLWHKQG